MQPMTAYTQDASTGVKESAWLMCDAWTPGLTSIQVNVYNNPADPPVVYTVFCTMDDPNDPSGPVPVPYVTWFAVGDTNLVNSQIPAQMYFVGTPRYVKLVQQSGPGVALLTVCQAGSVTQ